MTGRVLALIAIVVVGCAGTAAPPRLMPAANTTPLPALEYPILHPPTAGTTWTTASADHGITVLDVWATWCAPCAKAFPLLDDLAARGGVTVVGLSIDDEDAAVHSFLRRVPARFPILRDRDQSSQRAPLAITAVPTLIVLDASGRVRWRVDNAQLADYRALPRLIEQLRGESAGK